MLEILQWEKLEKIFFNTGKGSFTLQFFSDCDCDSSYHNKWDAEDSMKVFRICDLINIVNSYLVHYKQKQIAVAIRKKKKNAVWIRNKLLEVTKRLRLLLK